MVPWLAKQNITNDKDDYNIRIYIVYGNFQELRLKAHVDHITYIL